MRPLKNNSQTMKEKVKLIYKWTKEYNTPIYNSINSTESNNIDWLHDENEDSFDQFMDFLTRVKPEFIILYYDTFSFEEIEEKKGNTIKDIKAANSFEILKRFEELIKFLKSKEDEITFLKLSFVDNGFCFNYIEFAEWYAEFNEVNEIIEDYKGISLNKSHYLINLETLKLAKELAKFELFKKATNKPQREVAASIFFKGRPLSKNIIHNISSIIEYGDSIGKMSIEDLIEALED